MNRHSAAIFLVGWLFFHSAFAQQADTSGGGSSSTITPSGSSSGSGAASVLIPSVGGATTTPSTTNPSSPTSQGGTPAPAAAAPISVPSSYGALPVTLTPGEGRFAAPPFKFSVSVLQGYDDNVFTAPTKTRPVLRGTPPALQPVRVPKIGSAVTNASLIVAVQSASPRTAFTLDAILGGLFYYNRPGKSFDYNDRLDFVFFHGLTPRINITATANISLLSQANFALINAPTTNNTGNYLIGSAKLDLTYLWSTRFSTVTSYVFDTTIFENKNQQASDLYNNTLGQQFRYLLSPRSTLVVEARVAESTYPNSPGADSSSQFLLAGFDTAFSPRLRGTVRAGGEVREFSSSNASTQISPYFESTVSYIYGHQSSISWTNWFGLQPSSLSSNEQQSYRTGLAVNHVFTGRITGSFGLNYNRIATTVSPGNTRSVETDLSFSLGLQYVINRHFTLNATYTLSQALYTNSFSDYYRNQFFIGGSYAF